MEILDSLPLLREVIGEPVEIIRATRLNEAPDYGVWALELRQPSMQVIVKLCGPQAQYSGAFERTAAVHALVRQQARLPMPEVIAAAESCRRWPWRYFIKAFIPGQAWAAVEEAAGMETLLPARAELGRAVASLHQITFDGFGDIGPDGKVQEPLPYPAALARHARQIIREPAGQDFFLAALEDRAEYFENVSTPSLCHEDLHKYNILLRHAAGTWNIAAILDFEKAWAGHSESDLARMDLWGMTGERFWAAYRAENPVDEGYALRRPIYQLLWCLEYAQPTVDHLTTTQAICRELALPLIEQFSPFTIRKINSGRK